MGSFQAQLDWKMCVLVLMALPGHAGPDLPQTVPLTSLPMGAKPHFGPAWGGQSVPHGPSQPSQALSDLISRHKASSWLLW